MAKPTLVLKVGFLIIWETMNREVVGYRKSSLKAVIVALLLIALIIIAPAQALDVLPAAAADDELLGNGGFENGTTPWQAYCGNLSISTEYVREGNSAANFTLESNRLEGWIYQDSGRDSFVAGERYNFTGYYATANNSDIERIFLRIRWYDENGTTIFWQEDSFSPSSQNASSDVVINEVQYNPLQSGVDAAYEWLELLNTRSQEIVLNGWEIADNFGTDQIPFLTLPPGGYVIVAASDGFFTNFPDFSGDIVFLPDGCIGNGLNNEGDRLILKDSSGNIIDSLSYGDDTTIMEPACQLVVEGHSAERCPAGLDTDRADDFVDNPNPSPGQGITFRLLSVTNITAPLNAYRARIEAGVTRVDATQSVTVYFDDLSFSAPRRVWAKVTEVIDGDTIWVEIDGSKYKVRYIGIDTPEQGEPFYEEATNRNKELVEGQTVRLEKDVSETDIYGRLLRYVYLDGTMVNAELVRLGYARATPYEPDIKYKDLFSQLEQEAKTAGLGMWAMPGFYGTASITNSDESRSIPAPDGYTVSARVGDEERESCQTLNGEYGPLDVSGEQGDTICFYVQGVNTGQTAEWKAGESTELNLTVIDNQPPSTPANVHKTTPDNDNTPSFTWDAATDALAGVAGYSIKIDDAEWTGIGNVTSWTSPDPVPDGGHTFFVEAIDKAGNEGEAGQVDFSIDAKPPSTPTNVHKTTPDNDNTPSFSWDTATDALAGVAGYSIKIDNATWTGIGNVTSWSSPDPVPDGGHTFFVKAIDKAGNEGEAGQADLSIDTTPPSTPANVHKTTPDNDNTPSFTWDTATDALAGVGEYGIKIDNGTWTGIGNATSWTSPDPVPDGDHAFFVKAIDKAGNEGEAGQANFSIDAKPPSTPTNVHKTTPDNDNTPSFSWDPATAVSAGVAGYSIKIDNATWTGIGNMTSWTSPDTLPDGNHTFFVKAKDNADNWGETGSVSFSIDTTPSEGESPQQPSPTPGKSWLQMVLVPTLAFMGVVCLILAFWLRKRG